MIPKILQKNSQKTWNDFGTYLKIALLKKETGNPPRALGACWNCLVTCTMKNVSILERASNIYLNIPTQHRLQ